MLKFAIMVHRFSKIRNRWASHNRLIKLLHWKAGVAQKQQLMNSYLPPSAPVLAQASSVSWVVTPHHRGVESTFSMRSVADSLGPAWEKGKTLHADMFFAGTTVRLTLMILELHDHERKEFWPRHRMKELPSRREK